MLILKKTYKKTYRDDELSLEAKGLLALLDTFDKKAISIEEILPFCVESASEIVEIIREMEEHGIITTTPGKCYINMTGGEK